MLRILWSLCTALALAGGVRAASQEPHELWSGNLDAPVPGQISGGSVIHARQLAQLLRRTTVLLVDVSNAPVRPTELAPGAPWLPVPHPVLPSALWIPGVGSGEHSSVLDQYFRNQLATATGGDLNRKVVFYCHARCWLSWNAAKRAIGYGYKHVLWFPDGIEGWTAARLPTSVAADPAALGRPRLAVLDLELSGDLGGPELNAEHAARLKAESARLRADLQWTRLYEVLDNSAAQGVIERLSSQQLYLHDCNGCDLEIGRQLRANLVLVAWVNRVSGLILTLTYEIHDVANGQISARKSCDFRGDNDVAWNHAIDYMVRHMLDEPSRAGLNSVSQE